MGVHMKQSIVLSFLLILSLNSAFASDDASTPNMNFKSTQLQRTIEESYKLKDKQQLMVAVKKTVKTSLDLKWELFSGLAMKIARFIPEQKELKSIFQIRFISQGNILLSKSCIYQNLDECLNELFSKISIEQLRSYMAMTHKTILIHDILLFALSDAPESTWIGSEYCTLEPQNTLVAFRTGFLNNGTVSTLWEHLFPASKKIESSNTDIEQVHAFVGCDNNIPPTTFYLYYEQLIRCFKGCGRNWGRRKSDDPLYFLAEPRARLYEYAYSLPLSRYTQPVKKQPKIVEIPSAKKEKTKAQLRQVVLIRENTALKTELDSATQTIVQLEQRCLQAEAAKAAQEKTTRKLLAEKYQLEQLIANTNKKHEKSNATAFEEENQRLKDAIEKQDRATVELQVKLKTLESDLKGQQILWDAQLNKISDLQEKLRLSREALNNQKLSQSEITISANAKLDTQEAKITVLEETVTSLQQLIDAQKKEIQKLKAKPKPQHNMRKLLQQEQAAREKLEAELAQKQKELSDQLTAAERFLAERKQEEEKQPAHIIQPESIVELEQIRLSQAAYIIDLHTRLNAAAMHIQHLSQWCSFLDQGWKATAAGGLSIEVDGELFILSADQLREYTGIYLREHVILPRQEAAGQASAETVGKE